MTTFLNFDPTVSVNCTEGLPRTVQFSYLTVLLFQFGGNLPKFYVFYL